MQTDLSDIDIRLIRANCYQFFQSALSTEHYMASLLELNLPGRAQTELPNTGSLPENGRITFKKMAIYDMEDFFFFLFSHKKKQ